MHARRVLKVEKPQSVMACTSRRRSLEICGASVDDLAALREHDESFYGLNSSDTIAESSGSDESDSDTPAEKRTCLQLESQSSDDEYFSDAEDTTSDGTSAASGAAAAMIRDALYIGCKCKVNHWTKLPPDQLEELVCNLRAMKRSELKRYVLGELAAIMKISSPSAGTASASSRKFSFTYAMLGVVVCREVFQDAPGLSHTLLRKLQEDAEHLLTTPQSSKSKGKPPPNILPTAVANNVVQFIKNYASRYGMPQPAAPRGRAAKAPTYLPASCTKKEIHCLYCDSEGAHPISLTTFKWLWKANTPDICIMKQMI